MSRLFPEGGDLAVLDQDVVEREQQLAVGARPVVGLARSDEDVPVETQLLAVVLANVWVVPVSAPVGHVYPVSEGLTDWDRRLRFMRPVVTILETQSMPMHGRVDVAVIGDLNGDRRALRHRQRRPRYGAVVGQH